MTDLATLMAVPGVDQAQFGRSTQALLDESAFGAVWFMRRTPADVDRNTPERFRLAYVARRASRGPPLGFDFAALPDYRAALGAAMATGSVQALPPGPIPVGGWDAFVFMLPVVADRRSARRADGGPAARAHAGLRRRRLLDRDDRGRALQPRPQRRAAVGHRRRRGAGRRRRRAASDGDQIRGRRARLVDRRRPARPRPRRHLDDPRRRHDRDARARAADLHRRAARALRAGAGRRADGRSATTPRPSCAPPSSATACWPTTRPT